MTSTAQQHKSPQQIQQEFSNLTADQSLGKLTALPAQTVYEARWALSQLQQQFQNDQNILEVIEPLARVVGGYEAFVFTQTAEMATVRSLIGGQPSNGMSGKR